MLPRNWRRRKPLQSEAFLQEQFARWLDAKGLLFTASMAGVNLHPAVAIMRKKLGCKKGTPDIAIYEPCGIYHGLFIELKAGKNKATPEQEQWKAALISKGYLALIMPGNLEFNEAFNWLRDVVENYLQFLSTNKEEV